MSQFYSLDVKKIKRETEDAVSIEFNIPSELKSKFKYQAGQYLTLQTSINGEKVRRAYSIWTSPSEDRVAVLVKKLQNGIFSTYANDSLKENDSIEVMIPEGTFLNKGGTSVYFAAGSGITPVFSMLKEQIQKKEQVSLLYVNKSQETTAFLNELIQLNEEHDNFTLNLFYTRSTNVEPIYQGRLNKNKCSDLVKHDIINFNADGYYLCGPEEMILDLKEFLTDNGVSQSKVHFELFTASLPSEDQIDSLELIEANVKMIIDDDEFDFVYDASSKLSILEAAEEEGLDVPFSCKGGVCCTCKAKILDGQATMTVNYALTDDEVEEGYVLTCQTYPKSQNITVSFDE